MADSTVLSREKLFSTGDHIIPPLEPIYNTTGVILPRREMNAGISYSLPPITVYNSIGKVLNRRTMINSSPENLNMPVIPPVFNNRGFELYRFTEDISLTSDTRVLSRRLTLIPDFTATPLSGDNPHTVQFTDTTTGGSVDSWEWDFGDGSLHTYEQNPEYTYTSSGTYSVTLRVYKYPGSLTVSKTNYITVFIVADFSADPTTTVVQTPIQFTDESTDVADTYEWDFGDGSPVSTEQNPTHIYEQVGFYTVTLTAILNGHASVEIKSNYITIGMLSAFTAHPQLGYAPLTVGFIDQSLGEPTSWNWNFGDGSPVSTEQNPTHIYTEFGNYNVTLTVSNSTFSDIETKVRYINALVRVVPEIPPTTEYGGGFTRLRGPSLIFD